MQPIVENSFWASFQCSNSSNYIKVSDDAVIDRIKTGVTEIIDTGNGAIVIVNDVAIYRCAVVDRIEAHGQALAFGGDREQQLVSPRCLYPSVNRRHNINH